MTMEELRNLVNMKHFDIMDVKVTHPFPTSTTNTGTKSVKSTNVTVTT